MKMKQTDEFCDWMRRRDVRRTRTHSPPISKSKTRNVRHPPQRTRQRKNAQGFQSRALTALKQVECGDDARVESFNGRLRQECLNAHWFLSLDDAKAKIGAWRDDYNETRPHSALVWATPAEFARGPEVPTSERY